MCYLTRLNWLLLSLSLRCTMYGGLGTDYLDRSGDGRFQNHFHLFLFLLPKLHLHLVLSGPHSQWQHIVLDTRWTGQYSGTTV